jgi:hypothetical protein
MIQTKGITYLLKSEYNYVKSYLSRSYEQFLFILHETSREMGLFRSCVIHFSNILQYRTYFYRITLNCLTKKKIKTSHPTCARCEAFLEYSVLIMPKPRPVKDMANRDPAARISETGKLYQ